MRGLVGAQVIFLLLLAAGGEALVAMMLYCVVFSRGELREGGKRVRRYGRSSGLGGGVWVGMGSMFGGGCALVASGGLGDALLSNWGRDCSCSGWICDGLGGGEI